MNGANGCFRSREGEKGARKLRFKILREATAEDRKSRDRKTGKLRIPADVQGAADAIVRVVITKSEPYLLTIADLVEKRYFPDVEAVLRSSSMENYICLWNRYLKPRIGRLVF